MVAQEKKLKVVHFLNQFFAGLGGEEQANLPVEIRQGAVGAGRALQNSLRQQGEVVATIISGDNYFNEQKAAALRAVNDALGQYGPDVVVAGPAFNAGRYGLACGEVCRAAQGRGIPAVTAMYHENPGVLEHLRHVYIVPTGDNPAEMSRAMDAMVRLALKLGRGVEPGPAQEEGYMPRGIRKPILRDRPAAVRAADMLVARLTGKPWATELPVQQPEVVRPAAALRDLQHSTLAMVTTGGLVPRGNPDRLVRGGAREFFRYSIQGLSHLPPSDWESVHRGFYTDIVNKNPHYILPLNIMRTLEDQGVFGSLYPWFFTTSGVGTAVADSKRMGSEMAQEMVKAGVTGCILVAT